MMIPASSQTRFTGKYSLQGLKSEERRDVRNSARDAGLNVWEVQIRGQGRATDKFFLMVDDHLGNDATRAHGRFKAHMRHLQEPGNQTWEAKQRLSQGLRTFYEKLLFNEKPWIRQLPALNSLIESAKAKQQAEISKTEAKD